MKYEGQICRAPMERGAFMLPVRVGCSYNRCSFCNLFRHVKPRELTLEEIEGELIRVKNLGGHPVKIFLGDGNAFDLNTEKLTSILEMIDFYFPGEREVNMDATVTGVLKKSDSELRKLADFGVKHLYLGIESGLDDVLAFMNKDHCIAQAVEAIGHISGAGMIYDAHIMTGVAGRGRGEENALALAEFLNRHVPGNIVNFSMFIHEEVEIFNEIKAGRYLPSDEYDNMVEEKILIENLHFSPQNQVRYEGFHDYIGTRVRGTLPKDREKMLAAMNKMISEHEDAKGVYSYVYGICQDMQKRENDSMVWERQG